MSSHESDSSPGGSPLQGRPEIEYPCPWEFRLLGRSEALLRSAVDEVFGHLGLAPAEVGHHSSSGKYLSLRVEVTVADQAMRDALFAACQAHPGVLYVL